MKTLLTKDPMPELAHLRANQLLQALEKVLINEGATEIHDFRVAFKRWRALVRVIRKKTGLPWKQSLEPLRIYYKECGRKRDLEIALSMVQKNRHRSPGLEGFLEAGILANTRETKAKGLKDIPVILKEYLSKLKTTMGDPESGMGISDLRKAEDKRRRQAARELQKDPIPWHQIRKELKDLFYLKELRKGSSRVSRKLSRILDILGDMQDHQSLLNWIKDYETRVEPSDENLSRIKKKAMADIHKEMRKLKPELARFLYPGK